MTGTSTVNHFELQEQTASGGWSAVKDSNGNVLSGTLAAGANTVTLGDLTVNTTAYASGDFTGGANARQLKL